MGQEERYQEDSVDLIDLIAVVWRYRLLIVVVTLLAVAGGWGYTALSSGESAEAGARYRAHTVLFFEPVVQTVVEGDRAPTVVRSYADVASRILEALSEPASLRSIAGAAGADGELAEPMVRALSRLTVAEDEDNPYISTLSLTDSGPSRAEEAVRTALRLLDARLSAMGLEHPDGDRPVYHVIEPVTSTPAGEDEAQRNRTTVIAVSGVTGFFLAIFLSFVLSYINRVRKDPEAMRKLRGEAE